MAWDKRLDIDNPRLFLDLIQMRRERKKDSIIIIVGERRSGKSYAAIKLAENIDKEFDVQKDLFFEPIEFLKRFNTIENKAIVLDEASEHIDRRSWWDIQNKIFSSLLTREGYRQNVIILTFPVLTDLDQRAIRLSSHLITMFGVNFEKSVSYGMAYRLKMFQLHGKTFPNQIQLVGFNQGSEKNLKIYGQMKMDWNKKVSEQNIAVLEEIENPQNYEKLFPKEFYIDAFKKGLIDTDKAREILQRMRFSHEHIELILKANTENTRPEQKFTVSFNRSDGGVVFLPRFD